MEDITRRRSESRRDAHRPNRPANDGSAERQDGHRSPEHEEDDEADEHDDDGLECLRVVEDLPDGDDHCRHRPEPDDRRQQQHQEPSEPNGTIVTTPMRPGEAANAMVRNVSAKSAFVAGSGMTFVPTSQTTTAQSHIADQGRADADQHRPEAQPPDLAEIAGESRERDDAHRLPHGRGITLDILEGIGVQLQCPYHPLTKGHAASSCGLIEPGAAQCTPGIRARPRARAREWHFACCRSLNGGERGPGTDLSGE